MSTKPSPTFGVPDRTLPWGDGKDQRGNNIPVSIRDTWYRLIVRLAQLTAERPIQALSPGPSPWEFTATTIGHLYVGAGASGAVLVRGADALALGAYEGFVPMAAGDVVELTYGGAAPGVTFVPSARA